MADVWVNRKTKTQSGADVLYLKLALVKIFWSAQKILNYSLYLTPPNCWFYSSCCKLTLDLCDGKRWDELRNICQQFLAKTYKPFMVKFCNKNCLLCPICQTFTVEDSLFITLVYFSACQLVQSEKCYFFWFGCRYFICSHRRLKLYICLPTFSPIIFSWLHQIILPVVRYCH